MTSHAVHCPHFFFFARARASRICNIAFTPSLYNTFDCCSIVMNSLSNRSHVAKSPASLRGPRISPSICHAAADSKPMWSGKNVAPPKKGRHFLHLDDFTKEELQDMLAQGAMAKKKFYARDETFKPFAGQTMAMIFTKPSARTRVSFESELSWLDSITHTTVVLT